MPLKLVSCVPLRYRKNVGVDLTFISTCARGRGEMMSSGRPLRVGWLSSGLLTLEEHGRSESGQVCRAGG